VEPYDGGIRREANVRRNSDGPCIDQDRKRSRIARPHSKISSAVRDKAIELQSAIISLQSTLLALQAQNQELLTENDRLKQALKNTEDWKAEAAQYSLSEVSPGYVCICFHGGESAR
jgi:hypothetical protein